MAIRAAGALDKVLPRIAVVDLTSQVQGILREKILSGELAPDQVISARSVADALGVSMTPVRNALDRLAGEGLVVMSPRRGTRVAAPTPDEIEECYDLRLSLEGYAAERAAQRLRPGDLAELEHRWRAFGAKVPAASAAASATASAIAPERARALAMLDRAFHEQVVALSGSGRLAQLYRTLELSLAVGRMYYLGTDQRLGQASHQQHRAIIDALATRDPATARAAAEEHVRHARAGMLAALRAHVEQT